MATDFVKLLTELQGAGYTDQQVAEAAEIDRTMITRLRTGNRDQPKYDAGKAIVELHKKATRRSK